MDSESRTDPLIGKTIAEKYKVLSKIGRGGMSSVYLAEHILIQRTVALKILARELAYDEISRKRFEAEARIAAQIDHPNATMIFDVGIDGELPFIVMEYLKGRTLKEVIKDQTVIPVERACRIIEQACAALAEAHSKGIVHRDLKPTNLMLLDTPTGEDRVKVLDFGIAKMLQPIGNNPQLTSTGTVVGTPHYMSPEQGLNKPLTVCSDIYSLGIALYEMLSGELSFDGPSSVVVLIKHLNDAPRPLNELNPRLAIPPGIEKAVMKCLEKEPADRFQSVGELVAELKRGLQTASDPVPAAQPTEIQRAQQQEATSTGTGSSVAAAAGAGKSRSMSLLLLLVIPLLAAAAGYALLEGRGAGSSGSSGARGAGSRPLPTASTTSTTLKRPATTTSSTTSTTVTTSTTSSTTSSTTATTTTSSTTSSTSTSSTTSSTTTSTSSTTSSTSTTTTLTTTTSTVPTTTLRAAPRATPGPGRQSKTGQTVGEPLPREDEQARIERERLEREVEAKRKELMQLKREAEEAARRKQLELEKQKVSAPPTAQGVQEEKKPRRRCGPTWCS